MPTFPLRLVDGGIVASLLVRPGRPQIETLLKAGQVVPAAKCIFAKIDTGAAITAIEQVVVWK